MPTPIGEGNQPNLQPLRDACFSIGRAISPTGGTIVCFESTVYPGVTEDLCSHWLSESSGLQPGIDFHVAYSPERVNPGDKERCLEKVIKIVSGDSLATVERVKTVYEKIVDAGIYVAPSIKVAEAAKILENVQRDVNIALMNEVSAIFDSIGVSTHEVVKAAASKWNFMPFSPGLVGGHCIAVDPYYLINLAVERGVPPYLMSAARSINQSMGKVVAEKCKILLDRAGIHLDKAKIGVLGLTFKENVPDLRNSLVVDLVAKLPGIVLVHDPMCDLSEAFEVYDNKLVSWVEIANLDCCILAVPHRYYLAKLPDRLGAGDSGDLLKPGGIFMDLKNALPPDKLPDSIAYWSL